MCIRDSIQSYKKESSMTIIMLNAMFIRITVVFGFVNSWVEKKVEVKVSSLH